MGPLPWCRGEKGAPTIVRLRQAVEIDSDSVLAGLPQPSGDAAKKF